jgi:hypothetical protein
MNIQLETEEEVIAQLNEEDITAIKNGLLNYCADHSTGDLIPFEYMRTARKVYAEPDWYTNDFKYYHPKAFKAIQHLILLSSN